MSSEIQRREFLVRGARLGALSLLAAVGGVLGGRRQVKAARSSCPGPRSCRECGRFGTCRLPQAIEARQERKGNP